MPKIQYISKVFRAGTLALIETANEIIEEYRLQGFILTLRQLYYQFVARDLIPNLQTEYKRLGSIINDGRLAGLIDWYSIEDRTRNLSGLSHWDDPAEIISACASGYRLDKWERQPCRIEVWIEKEALAGVFQKVCNDLDIPLLSCRGYTSQSEMWLAARRLQLYAEDGQEPIILHFGDHDPSGIDMTRDIIDRMDVFGCDLEVDRLALNMDQVEQYRPPPNPAKVTDSRFKAYLREYGGDSWELDALEPSTLAELVRSAVEGLKDEMKWIEEDEKEERERELLIKVSENWDTIKEGL